MEMKEESKDERTQAYLYAGSMNISVKSFNKLPHSPNK